MLVVDTKSDRLFGHYFAVVVRVGSKPRVGARRNAMRLMLTRLCTFQMVGGTLLRTMSSNSSRHHGTILACAISCTKPYNAYIGG